MSPSPEAIEAAVIADLARSNVTPAKLTPALLERHHDEARVMLEAAYAVDITPPGSERYPVKAVIVITGPDDAMPDEDGMQQLSDDTRSTVLYLAEGATLETLDHEDMRRHGWVRAQQEA